MIVGTFGCLVPYLSGDWRFHQPPPYWWVARAVGVLLICAGLVPLPQSFAGFVRAGGTPVPVAPPLRLVVTGVLGIFRARRLRLDAVTDKAMCPRAAKAQPSELRDDRMADVFAGSPW